MKKLLIQLLRWGIPLAILVYLFHDFGQDDQFGNLQFQRASWRWSAMALLMVTAATLLSIFRWYLLVRALDLKFTLLGALQLGFLGELFYMVSFGLVGGDAVKAILLARDQPGRRVHAVSTVLVDRVVGLYSMFVLASVMILVTGVWRGSSALVNLVCQLTLLLTIVGTCALVLLLFSKWIFWELSSRLSRLPFVGRILFQIVQSLARYRRRWPVVAAAILVGVGVHSSTAACVYCIAQACTTNPPTLAHHFVIMPLANVTSILPLPMSGLGAFEAVMDMLYKQVSGAAAQQGVLVALGYRVVSLAIVAIGMVVYFVTQSEIAAVIREVKRTR